MPFETVENLKESDLFDRVSTLQQLSTDQLRKFVQVFDSVHERVLRNDGDPDQAESNAIALALPAAKRATLPTEEDRQRSLEDEVHFFATMMPEQFAMSDPREADGEPAPDAELLDLGFFEENPRIASAIMRDNLVTVDHDDEQAAGIIRDVIHPSDAPEEVQEATDPDAPFLVVASYFEDTPDDIKESDGISPEFTPIRTGGERDLAVPSNFTIGDDTPPLNAPETGIKKVATLTKDEADGVCDMETLMPAGEPDKGGASTAMSGDGTDDDPSIEDLQQQVASLKDTLDEVEDDAKLATDLDDRFSNVESKLDEFQQNLASALGMDEEPDEEPEDLTPDRVATLIEEQVEEETEELRQKVATMKEQKLRNKAEEFSQGLVEDGKIASDAADEWEDRYVDDPEGTQELADTLPEQTLGESEGFADQTPEREGEDPAAQVATLLDPALQDGGEE